MDWPSSVTRVAAAFRHRWRLTAPVAALLFLFGACLAAVAFPSLWFSSGSPRRALGVLRFPPPSNASADATTEAAVERSGWTEYHDYGTVLLDRVERPARLLTGRNQWVRQVRVPPAGARYEAYIGAIDAPVTVHVGRTSSTALKTLAPVGAWTRVRLDLDARAGPSQSVAVDVEVPPGAVAAWGTELVTTLRRDDDAPDVIFVSLDTVRRDQLTPYVPTLRTTPALAAFAREALVFDQAVSTSSWTIASHAALFTGHFPADSLGYTSRVEPGEYTLPEIFAANGYRTFGVSGGPYTDPRWGLHQGFDEYVASGPRENARDATTRAIEWMTQGGEAPAFLFLNYFNAHEPLELSQEVRLASGVSDDVPSSMWQNLDMRRRPMTSAARHRLLGAYRAELTAMDDELGRLFDYLRRNGRWDRTVVIVWSDHGQLLGERGRIGHAYTLDEELIRVPLMIKTAASHRLPVGIYRPPLQGDDLFALSQALAGIPNTDGGEIVAALNANASIRRLAFSKIHHDPLPALTAHPRWRSATQWAVSDGFTKIVRDLEGRSLAYDITGPEARSIPMPGSESLLVTALQRFRSWSERPSLTTVAPLSPSEVERLRALGYIQ